jgi:hypothetical protein
MKNKVTGLFIALLMCAVFVNGFCGGQKDQEKLGKLEKRIDDLQNDVNNSLQQINLKIDSIEKGQPPVGDIVNKNGNDGGNTGDQPFNSGAVIIESQGTLAKSTVISYIKNLNPAISGSDVENLIDTYFKEAEKEGINHDLAIAQMLFITKSLTKKALTDVHNYAGLNIVNKKAVRFNSMAEGVRAHIQHLKGYSSSIKSSELKEPLVDPRWSILDPFRGKIKILDELSVKWAPGNSEYAGNIENIMNEMRRF